VSRTSRVGEADERKARWAASTPSTRIKLRVVARDTLAWREHTRRLTRQTTGFSQELPGMETP